MASQIIDGDLKLTNYDLTISGGDFVLTPNAEQQETDLLINTFIGNWFQYPAVGVGIINYLAGNTPALTLENIIKQQMITDGFTVQSVSVQGSTIESIKISIQAFRA